MNLDEVLSWLAMMRTILRALFTILLFGAAVFAQQSTPDFSKAHDEALKFLAELVKINTSNPPGNEARAAEYIKGVLAAEGIQAQIYESAPGRGNLVARLKGNGKKKPLLLMGHLDVVGVERDKWTVDPFAAMVKEGYLYGRGSHDDKGMDAANLEVLLLLHRLKVPLDRDVILLAEAGEEGTTDFGIDFMVANHWNDIACEYAFNEGGGTAEEYGTVQYVSVSTTEKVTRGLILKADRSSAHGPATRPDHAEGTLDVRALPDENMDALKASLARLINDPAVEISSTPGNQRPATPPSGLDNDGYHALEKAQQKIFPGVQTIPIMQVGATDSSELRAKGVQAYGIGTPASRDDNRRVHGNDERTEISGFGKFIQFLYAATTELAGTK